jgi:PAS domain S-box-containing protein
MNLPQTSSIRRKVMRVIMLASLTVMLVTVAAFMAYDLVTFRQTMVRNLATQARTVAENSTAALEFRLENDASGVLASLRTEPHIIAAALYDAQGRLFVKYPASMPDAALPAAPQSTGYHFGNSSLTLYQPVMRLGKKLGTIYLQSDLTALTQRMQLYGVISLLIMVGSGAVAFWLSTTLQRRITNPIVALAATAQKISEEHNYSLRAPKLSDDELGSLTDAFNEMLERIQAGTSALQESEMRERERAAELAVVIEAMPVPVIIVHDPDARHMTGNRAADHLARISSGGEISVSAPDNLKPNHFKSFKDGRELRADELPAQRAARGEPVKDFEFELVFDDGTVMNLLGSGTPLLDEQGHPRGAVHTLVDITERKRHEVELAKLMQQTDAQARLFDATLSSITDLAYTFDLEGNWIYANKALLKIWGKSLKEITGKSSLELGYPPELAERLKQQVKEVVATRQPVRGETYFTDAAGVEDYHEYIFSPVLAADGTVTAVCGTTRLTTERKRAEALLREGERRFRQLADAMPQMVWITQPDGTHEYFNDRWYEYTGVPAGSTGGAGWEELFHPEDEQRVRTQWKHNLATGELYEIEYRLKHHAGGYCWFLCRAVPVRDESGRILKWFGTCTDIENFKRVEETLRQNEALFSALVEQAPNGVYVVDGQFRLQQINARALPAFAKVEPKIGRDFGEVMEILWGKEVGAQLAGIFRHTLDTGEPYRSPRFAEHRVDLNEEKAYEWETQRITLPDGTHGVVCYFNDITETERNKANLAFLATISDDLLRLDTVDEILNTVCAKICEYLKLTIGCFVEINEAADISNVTHEWRLAEVPGLIGTYKLSEYLSADFQKILRAGECFIVRDTATDTRVDAEKYTALKIRSFICVPLIADGRWKFMFDIHDARPRDWREDEISLVRELTARIWARLERVRADSLLRQNEALFAALIEEAPVGVYVINAQFRVQQINTRALPSFEKVEPKMGRTLTEVMHIQWGKEAGDELAAIFRHTLDTGEPYISPGYSNIRADLGEERTYEWQTRRVTLPNGSHGVVCYFNDITERIRSEQALMQAKTAAETANRSKDDFLAALSHELRTPLNPVLLLASEAAEDPQLPAEVRAQFATIRNNVELEARLIDDLLDLTRITRGKLLLNKQSLNVHQVLHEAINIVRPDAEAKKITLGLEFCAEDHQIYGDSVRLHQVFWNVLKNAVKFTPPAGRVTVKTFAQGDGFFIEVTDTGIGINADELKRVFTAFAQGDHAEGGSHRFGGLGLRLAISQRLVELHSGLIQASSDGRDKGATFTIQLPLSAAANQTHNDEGPVLTNDSQLPAQGQRILLVEDHEPTRTALAHLLMRRHFTVLTAASLAEARAVAGKNKIDLLISDIGLPDGNGYDLMSEMRKAFGLKGIALTGYGMEDDVLQSKQAGFVAHLTKPVRIQSLDTVLASALTA